jgi:hypothetical protein
MKMFSKLTLHISVKFKTAEPDNLIAALVFVFVIYYSVSYYNNKTSYMSAT